MIPDDESHWLTQRAAGLVYRLRARTLYRLQATREARAAARRNRGRCAAHRADDLYYGEEAGDELFLIVETLRGTARHDEFFSDWIAVAERTLDCRECALSVLRKLSAPSNDVEQ